jgi:hypothetical protein
VAALTVRRSTGSYADSFTLPSAKPNIDVKSAPHQLSKGNQQRQQHACTRPEQGVRHRRPVIITGSVQNVVEDRAT